MLDPPYVVGDGSVLSLWFAGAGLSLYTQGWLRQQQNLQIKKTAFPVHAGMAPHRDMSMRPFSSVWSELRTFNPQVVGSNPTGGT